MRAARVSSCSLFLCGTVHIKLDCSDSKVFHRCVGCERIFAVNNPHSRPSTVVRAVQRARARGRLRVRRRLAGNPCRVLPRRACVRGRLRGLLVLRLLRLGLHADDAARRRGAARRRDGRVWRLHARVRVRVIDDVDLAAWGQVRRYLSHVARPAASGHEDTSCCSCDPPAHSESE